LQVDTLFLEGMNDKLLQGHYERINTTAYIDLTELEKILDKTFLIPNPKSKEDAERWRSRFVRVREKLNNAGKIINRDILPALREKSQ